MKEYCCVLEQRCQQQVAAQHLMLAHDLSFVLAYGEASFKRFLEVLPEEPVQGLAIACQNRLNILCLSGDHTAKTIAGKRLTSNRPRALAQELYDNIQNSCLPQIQDWLYVVRIMEKAFLDLALCAELTPVLLAGAQ